MNKQSEKLAKAIAYETKKKQERDEDKRPAFHVTPTTGWCNDPNGFSRFGEEYHLFYQYYPYENKWGPMHLSLIHISVSAGRLFRHLRTRIPSYCGNRIL